MCARRWWVSGRVWRFVDVALPAPRGGAPQGAPGLRRVVVRSCPWLSCRGACRRSSARTRTEVDPEVRWACGLAGDGLWIGPLRSRSEIRAPARSGERPGNGGPGQRTYPLPELKPDVRRARTRVGGGVATRPRAGSARRSAPGAERRASRQRRGSTTYVPVTGVEAGRAPGPQPCGRRRSPRPPAPGRTRAERRAPGDGGSPQRTYPLPKLRPDARRARTREENGKAPAPGRTPPNCRAP